MGRHYKHHDWMPGGHDRDSYSGYPGDGPGAYPLPRLSRRNSWIVVITGLVVWSLLAWVAYALTDPVLGWIAASAGLVLESGKNIATAAGAGKEVGTVVDGINASGFLGQAIALLRLALKPVIVIVWATGALAIIAAPLILRKIGGRLARLRHR